MEESVSSVAEKGSQLEPAWPKKDDVRPLNLHYVCRGKNGNLREITEERYPDTSLYIYINRACWLTRLGGLAPARPIMLPTFSFSSQTPEYKARILNNGNIWTQ